jgi:hypothetical protein
MQKAVEQRGVGALGVQVEGNDLWCLFNERNKIVLVSREKREINPVSQAVYQIR